MIYWKRKPKSPGRQLEHFLLNNILIVHGCKSSHLFTIDKLNVNVINTVKTFWHQGLFSWEFVSFYNTMQIGSRTKGCI
jgi:hypothetical protein